jgi:hypothetical protein
MRTTAPDGSAPKKSPLRINKQESLAAGLLPRGLADEPIAPLNRFFADYLKAHTQGGTNSLQRNLAHLFEWLVDDLSVDLIARPFDLMRLMGWH